MENTNAEKEYINKNSNIKLFTFITIYIFFLLSFLVAIVPIGSVSVFALMICICTLSAVYTLRLYEPEDSLFHNHATYIIKTFWKANLYLAISSFAALLFMLATVNYAPLEPCVNTLASIAQNGNVNKISKILNICSDLLIENNSKQFITMAFIAFAPIFIYILYRCIKGWISLIYANKILIEKNK